MTAVLTVAVILALTFGVVYLIAVEHWNELRAADPTILALLDEEAHR